MTFFRSPFLAGANVIFGVLAGVFAASFHEDLVNSTPLIWIFEGTDVVLDGLNERAASFWAFLLLFSSIWVVREWVAASDRRNEVEQLEALIETVPPPDFLQQFESAYKRAVVVLRNAGGDSVDFEAIRAALDLVIVLADQWDYRTSKSTDVYRANIMLNLGSPRWTATLAMAGERVYGKAQWKAFGSQDVGILWVDRRLATADPKSGDTEKSGDMDGAVRPLALVYDGGKGGNDVNLDGAPVAFAEERVSYIGDCKTISTNFPRDLSANCRSRVEAYYRDNTKARSLISLPIPGESGLLGTLNIYRSSIEIMGGESGATKFTPFLVPFLLTLGQYLQTVDFARLPDSAGAAGPHS
jgi:hypothetical protein